jgi:hypothetical protein
MSVFPRRSRCVVVGLSLTLSAVRLQGQQDVDEIARQMSNPTLPLMNITTLVDYTGYKGDLPGAADQSSWTLLFQPPLPFPVSDEFNLIFRPAIPFLFNQPVPTLNGFESAGVNLGNIGYDLLLGGTTSGGVLRGVGLVGTIPTATDETIRANWAVGPEAVVGLMKPWGVFLLLGTQSWDVSGSTKTSRLGGQYALAFSLPGGWQIVSSAPFTYNWDTEQLTLPLGAGPFKTVMVGATPVKLGLQAWYYVAQPDAFGQEWQLRLQVQPSVRRPW